MSQSASNWTGTSTSTYDPYDFKKRRVQATDGPSASYYEKRLKLPHMARFKLENIAARHGYPSMDSLIRDLIQRGIFCLGQQENDIEATELANLWAMRDAAEARVQAIKSVDETAKLWQQIIRETETPDDLTKAVWEADQYIKSLPSDSPHRRRLEEMLMKFLGGTKGMTD